MAHVYNSQLDAYSLYHKHHDNFSSSPSTVNGPALPALGHAIAGSTGSAISNLCIYPLDLIITRLQVQRQLRASSSSPADGEYKGVLDAATQIYTREGGISGFYQGVVQDTSKSIADSFLFFLFYNYLRQNRLQTHGSSNKTLPALDELAVGALAGACSKFLTTPIANIVTRKQTASMLSARSSTSSSSPLPSVSDIAKQIRAEKGLLGFWSGYSASLVLTLNPSITFFLHESFKRYLLPQSERENPGAKVTFLMAAVSKAVASSITYPFSLAKARAQTAAPALKPSEKDTNALSSSRSTVFATIFRIYRTEGPAALYEGVWGELFRGFFSHGITMIVKEAVHKLIIQLYLLSLRLLKRGPARVLNDLKERAGDAYERASLAGYKASEGARKSDKQAVESAAEGGKATADAYERASLAGFNAAEEGRKSGRFAAESVVKGGKTAGGDAYERASLAGYNSAEGARKSGKEAVLETAKATADAYERASLAGYNAAEGERNESKQPLAEITKATADAYERASLAGYSAAEGVRKGSKQVVLETAKATADAYERASLAGYSAADGVQKGSKQVVETVVEGARATADAYERASLAGYSAAQKGVEQAGTAVSGAVEKVVDGVKAGALDFYEIASVSGYNTGEVAKGAVEQRKK